MGIFRHLKGDKAATKAAKKQRDEAKKRHKESQALITELRKISEENHFADAIIKNVLKGHGG